MIRALLSPRMLLLHAVAILGVTGAGWLGLWQYDAWADHRHDKANALKDAAPKPLQDVLGADDPFPGKYVGQPVTLDGTWLPDETVFIEGKTVNGETGYWVVTPVELENASAILVVRGWAAHPEGTAPTTPNDEVALHAQISGWLQPGEEAGAEDDNPTDDVLPSLRIPDLLQRVDVDLYGGYVIARDPVEAGLTPVTPDQLPKPGAFTSIRNLLYGIEWWVFGGFAVFLWWRWCRDEVERVRSVTDASEDGLDVEEPEVPSSA